MKHKFSKIVSVLAAFMMVFGLVLTNVKAAEGDPVNGTITINQVKKGETYKVYKIFDATYDNGAVSYTTSSNDVVTLLTDKPNSDSPYFTFTKVPSKNVWSVTANSNLTGNDGTIRNLIDDVLRSAIEAGTFGNAVATTTVNDDATSITFNNLPSGYYYVTSTQGTLVSINTSTPDVSVDDKNTSHVPPKPDKEIEPINEEDLKTNSYAQIGEVIPFKVTVHAKDGAENYKLVDTMSSGLELVMDNEHLPSIMVGNDTYTYDSNSKEFKHTEKGTIATLSTGTEAGNATLIVNFKNETLKNITDKQSSVDIVVRYFGKVVDTSTELDRVTENNNVYLKYGNSQYTESNTVNVYKSKLTINKVDGDNEPLADAHFEIKKDGNVVQVKQLTVGSYIISDNAEENTLNEVVSGNDGKIVVRGLENGNYTFTETKAPAGYNHSATTYTFEINDQAGTDKGIDLTFTVQNLKGNALPSTGGMGTTMIYLAGGIMVAGAAILLVTKKRANQE